MGRGRRDPQIRAASQADPASAPDPVPDLAERCARESGWTVAHEISQGQLLALLSEFPEAADGQVTLVEGDYGWEGYETFGVECTLGELLTRHLGDIDEGASWEAICAALASEGELAQEVEVMEGDYGWEGWEDYETRKTLEQLVRAGLGNALSSTYPFTPPRPGA